MIKHTFWKFLGGWKASKIIKSIVSRHLHSSVEPNRSSMTSCCRQPLLPPPMTEADIVFSDGNDVGMEGRITSVGGGAGEESHGLRLGSGLSCLMDICIFQAEYTVTSHVASTWRTASGMWFGETSRQSPAEPVKQKQKEFHQTTYQKPYPIGWEDLMG